MLASVTFLACLALPVPRSILMLTAGGFVASGDLVLRQVLAAALSGAIAGDQVGYRIGLYGGANFLNRLAANPTRGKLITKAVDHMDRCGGNFFTRWLFAPVGPWANFAAGANSYDYIRFTLWAIAGEAVWVALYVLMGFSFAGNIQAASDLAGLALGIVAGVAAMLGSGYWLIGSMRQEVAA